MIAYGNLAAGPALTFEAAEPFNQSRDGPHAELWIHRLGHVQFHYFTSERRKRKLSYLKLKKKNLFIRRFNRIFSIHKFGNQKLFVK